MYYMTVFSLFKLHCVHVLLRCWYCICRLKYACFHGMKFRNLRSVLFIQFIFIPISGVLCQDNDTSLLTIEPSIYQIDTSYFAGGSDGFNVILAAEQGDMVAMEILLRRGAPTDYVTGDGVTALMYAAERGDIEAMRILLEHGADVNAEPYNGITALSSASKYGDYEGCVLLMDYGADVNHKDADGLTPLMNAVAYNYYDLVELFVENGADYNEKDLFGSDAMIMAAWYGSFESMDVLLRNGANSQTTDKYGFTPLITASQQGHYEIVWYLLDKGVDIHQKNNGGYDALSVAVINDNRDIVEFLIQHGADVNSEINVNKNVLDLARETKDQELISMLKENGARSNRYPGLNYVSGGLEMNFNFDDFMLGPGLGLVDSKYGLMLYSKLLIRPSAIRVLESDGETRSYQFWERRFMLTCSLDKMIKIATVDKADIGIYTGAGVGYSWGSFRGSERKPVPKAVFMPGGGLYLRRDFFSVDLTYHYTKLDIYDISPHRMSLSIRFYINIGNRQYMNKEIRWF